MIRRLEVRVNPWSAMLCAGLFTGGAAIVLGANCTPNGAVSPGVDNVAGCILDTVSKDVASGIPYESAVIDAATKCVGSASTSNVQRVKDLWSTSRAAQLRASDAGGGD